MNKMIYTQPGQTYFDAVIQYYGTMESVGLFLQDNPGITDITDIPAPGSEIVVQDPVPALTSTNKRAAEEFKNSGLFPATLYPII